MLTGTKPDTLTHKNNEEAEAGGGIHIATLMDEVLSSNMGANSEVDRGRHGITIPPSGRPREGYVQPGNQDGTQDLLGSGNAPSDNKSDSVIIR